MIRAISILLILWGCALAQAPIEITSSTPMGMPCGGISTVGCMPDAQCGWMVVVRTGDTAAFSGKLTYADAEGKQQTATVTAAATGEYTALAFRVGVFRPGTGNRFVSAEVTSLKAAATVRQDAAGAIITVGETTWGPPVDRLGVIARWNRLSRPSLQGGDTLLRFQQGSYRVVALRFIDGKVVVEQPEVATHPVMVGESLSCNLCTTIVRVLGDPAQATTNLKEYHQ